MSSQSQWKKIDFDDVSIDVHITNPTHTPVRGGIVMLHEIFGINKAMQQKAEKFADAGYLVAMPDLFWRSERRINLGYGEQDRKKGFSLMQEFSFTKGIHDIIAVGSWVNKQQNCVERVGTLGFCIGGKLAILAGAHKPFKAAIALYGVKLDDNTDLLRRYPVPVQVHVGDNDAHIPIEASLNVQRALQESAAGEIFIYSGAQHGFFNASRTDTYDPQAAELAQTRVLQFLDGALA